MMDLDGKWPCARRMLMLCDEAALERCHAATAASPTLEAQVIAFYAEICEIYAPLPGL